VAVSAFVSSRPTLPLALRFGGRWALGHSIAVLGAGSILLASGLTVPAGFDRWAERFVGVMLIAVGVWSIRSIRRLHLHGAPAHGDHAHLHQHPAAALRHDHRHGAGPGPKHHHPRGAMLVGLLHGLAGTTGAVALVPVTLIPDWRMGFGYLVVFSAGVTAGMTLFALLLAQAIRSGTAGSLSRGPEWWGTHQSIQSRWCNHCAGCSICDHLVC
jgi:ABC-type nickel/cobalt efflux system permease component RcnA